MIGIIISNALSVKHKRAVPSTMFSKRQYHKINILVKTGLSLLIARPLLTGAHIRGVWVGAKPPLASECHQKSVPFFFDTVLKLGPKIRVQELIFTSVSEFGLTTQELGQVYFFILSIFPYRPRFNPLWADMATKKLP